MIGVGNAGRGDDAAGLLVARRLGGIELEGDPSALLDLFDGVDEAVVIDGVRSGAEPGTVHRFDVGAGPVAAVPRGASTHLLGLAEDDNGTPDRHSAALDSGTCRSGGYP